MTNQPIPNTDIAPVQANHLTPWAFSKNPFTGDILPVIRHSLPKGSARIAVVWCPLCDYSQQVNLGNTCQNCKSVYSYDDPTPAPEYEEVEEASRFPDGTTGMAISSPLEETASEAETRTDDDTYCQPCGRQLMNSSGLASHVRSQAHADRLELLAKSEIDSDDSENNSDEE